MVSYVGKVTNNTRVLYDNLRNLTAPETLRVTTLCVCVKCTNIFNRPNIFSQLIVIIIMHNYHLMKSVQSISVPGKRLVLTNEVYRPMQTYDLQS